MFYKVSLYLFLPSGPSQKVSSHLLSWKWRSGKKWPVSWIKTTPKVCQQASTHSQTLKQRQKLPHFLLFPVVQSTRRPEQTSRRNLQTPSNCRRRWRKVRITTFISPPAGFQLHSDNRKQEKDKTVFSPCVYTSCKTWRYYSLFIEGSTFYICKPSSTVS